MKISFNWLKQFITIDETPQKVAELLTASGLEVEAAEPWTSNPNLKGLVVGEVLTCEKHPDADRLKITTVNVGLDTPLQIVCGAPNVAAGQKVMVATVGAVLHPTSGAPFEIKKSKIRGAVSEGMICAEDEIGLGESHDGIMVLPEETKIGTSAESFFQVENDVVLEIGLTPNRADAMSHFGVARDLLAVLKAKGLRDYSAPTVKLNVDKLLPPATMLKPISVKVHHQEACPRYCGVVITGLKVAPSPDWLQNRLKAIGLSPINNVVDVTNYILHGLGQPLHAFDYDKIGGATVNVRPAWPEETLVTLDQKERKLDGQDLMICDAQNAMCIGGVFGGYSSGVSAETNTIFLESAYFNPVWIRKTAKRHGLSTDASFRFERGIDPGITMDALKIATKMLLDICGGELASDFMDTNPNIATAHKTTFNVDKMNAFLGTSIPEMEVKQLLAALDITVENEQGSDLHLAIPAYRNDVLRAVDVYEDVLRLYGFDRVPFPEKHQFSAQVAVLNTADKWVQKASNYLSAVGFTEAMSLSLTSAKYYQKHSDWSAERLISLTNPLSTDLQIMRQTLLFNALESVLYNQNRQVYNLRAFEFGKSYAKTEDSQIVETPILSLLMCGQDAPEQWGKPSAKASYFNLKGALSGLLGKMGISEENIIEEEDSSQSFDLKVNLYVGKTYLGYIGQVGKSLLADFDIKQVVYFAELNWQSLLDSVAKYKLVYKPLPKYPAVRRDLALIVGQEVKYADLRKVAFATERKLLQAVNLFDVYQGKNIPENTKSYALSFVLQDETKTLDDKQVDKTMQRLLQAFQQQVNATLRQ